MVFRTKLAPAIDCNEPTMRNSNLLPVKAKGEVRLRSVVSLGSEGSELVPRFMMPPALLLVAPPASIWSRISVKLFAQEDRDDGRRSFIGAQAVVVARTGGGERAAGRAYSSTALMTALRKTRNCTFSCGRLAGLKQVLAVIGGHRPVVVLAGAVDAGKGLFVQQADQTVAQGDLSHRLHHQLVVVGGDVGGGEDRGHFILGRGHFVVLGLGGNAQFPELGIQIVHEGRDAVLDRCRNNGLPVPVPSAAWRRKACGRSGSGPGAVRTVLIDQEIFLLGTDGGGDPLGGCIAQRTQHPQRLAGSRRPSSAAAGSSCPALRRCKKRRRWGYTDSCL